MESQVQTFDNTKYCLYFTIPPFLQFLNYNSQIGMFPGSMFHASTCFTFKVCQYLKLKTCLWSCKKEWFNLELEPKIDLSRQSGMSSIFRNSTVMARSPFQYKTKPNCLQESKRLFKKIYKEKDIIFSCYLWTNNFFFLYWEPHVHSNILNRQQELFSECQPLQSPRLVSTGRKQNPATLPLCQCARAIARVMSNVISF